MNKSFSLQYALVVLSISLLMLPNSSVFCFAPTAGFCAESGACESYFRSFRTPAAVKNNKGTCGMTGVLNTSEANVSSDPDNETIRENGTIESRFKSLSFGFETDITSKYIWYGIPLSKGGVTQSSLWLEENGWTYTVYGNFDLTDRLFNQFNLYISKSLNTGALETEFALQSYFYPHTEDSPMTNEFILTLTKPFKNFNLYLAQSWDIKTYKGSYVADLGLSIERAAGAKGLLKTAVYLEYGSKTFNEVNLELPKAAFNSAGAEISYTYTRKDGIYFRPHAEYSAVIDKDLKELVEKPDTWSYGFAVGKNF